MSIFQEIQHYCKEKPLDLPVQPCGCMVQVGAWTIDTSLGGEMFDLLIADNDHFQLIESRKTVSELLDIIRERKHVEQGRERVY